MRTCLQIVRTGALVALLAGLSGGCARYKPPNLRGEGFAEDETSRVLHRARPADPENKDKWGFSTKSRQIEDELGIR
ncbi:MAG: hypothetical protein JNG90_02335 [Planctomycetaceae bacterium]|nr:hypothetical protein [Planctomycetaceae bacterium]